MRRRLGRVWQAIENSDIETADASESIEEHRERQQRLEIAAEEAHALLAKRRVVLDSADKITAFAEEMSEFLQTSEITETRAFVRPFVTPILVKPGWATIHYTIPTPPDSPIGGADPTEGARSGQVVGTVNAGWATLESNQ